MNQSWRQSILVRILLPTIVLIIISNIAILLITVSKLDEQLRSSSDDLLRNELQKLEGQFRRSVEEIIIDTRLMRDLPPVQGIPRAAANNGVDPIDGSSVEDWGARMQAILKSMLQANPSLVQLRYIRIDGEELVRVDRYGANESVRIVSSSELQNKFKREYFQETIALKEGEVYISDIDLNYEAGKIMEPRHVVMRAATPVYLDDELVGIMIVNESFDSSFESLKPLTQDSRKLIVANAKGEYLFHYDSSKAITSSGTEHGNFYQDHGIDVQNIKPETIDFVHGENETVALNTIAYNPYNSEEFLIIGLIEDYSAAPEVRVQMLNQAYLLIGVALLISIILVGINAQRIAAPIGRMKRLLEQSNEGVLAEELPLDAPGEVGTLARAFDQVFKELNQRQKQLTDEVAIRKSTQNELEESIGRLAQANHELSQFAFIASHDLQEPLRTIISFIGLLEEDYADTFDDDGKQYLKFITESSQRMQDLIKGLLDFSRVGRDVVPEFVDCNSLVQAIKDDLSVNLTECGGIIESDNLPSFHAFKTEMRLLLQNLISNSLKFSQPNVPPVVKIAAERQGGMWQFTVTDNGIGIPEEYRDRVFRIFQRLHGKNEFEGTGIGLAHCKKIVALHGGDIWIGDAPSQGCRIFFTVKDMQDEAAQ